MKFLNLEEVLEIHTLMLERYGGLDGMRDRGLLLSAIEMPKATMFGEYLHPSPFDKAAAYLFHIIGNHPFIDGNKRTGAASALVFLDMNGFTLRFDDKIFEDLVVQVGDGRVDKKEISHFFQQAKIRT